MKFKKIRYFELLPFEIIGHSLVFQIPTACKDAYKKSFFPKTIRDWNVLPDSLISSAELSDDCVSKFTSLVRARDQSSSANPLVRYCHFGVSPVNYSDSENFVIESLRGR